jgi:uncharacterized SAM-binding protein YcdF (DUF218 family)
MYDFAKSIANPYPLLLILIGVSMLRAWRRRGQGRRALLLAAVAWTGLLVVSFPAFSRWLMGNLERQFPPPESLPLDVDVIVTLGGGIDPPGPFRSYPEVDGSSFTRCLQTAAIYDRLGGRTVVLCGGPSRRVAGGQCVAEVMKQTLLRFGLKEQDLLAETTSLSTYENATQAAELLRRHHLKKAILITHGRHMPRAVWCFRKQGIEVVPVPCDSRLGRLAPRLDERLVPSTQALEESCTAFQEGVALLWYRIHGRV